MCYLADAVELMPDDYADKSVYMDSLGTALQRRFERLGELGDLEAAIAMKHRAVELTPDDHPDKSAHMTSLGNALQTHFEHVGEVEDLEATISVQQHAIEVMPDDHPAKPVYMNNLGNALNSRFKRLDKPGYMSTLGGALQSHFERVDKTAYMSTLGSAFQSRFAHVGDLGDLDTAISMQRHAVDLTDDGHPYKPAWIDSLCASLESRFEHIGEVGDLEAAISLQRHAVELSPDGHPAKPARMNTLGTALQRRFEHLGELGDLEAAIAMKHRAVQLTPDDHPDKPSRMSNLGNGLQSRFKRVGALEDIEDAISVQRNAIELIPDGHPDRPVHMNNLGDALHTRFERVGELEDLQAAIAMKCRAVELIPDGHPSRPLCLWSLGLSFRSLYEQNYMHVHFEAAYRCFIDAAIHSSGNPFSRFRSARDCVEMLAKDHEFASAEMILEAHSHVLRLLPERVWLGHSVIRRYEESSQLAECVNEAVAAAIGLDALQQAVAWLEEGRSLVWSQVLALRTPLDELEIHHPELSQRLRILQQKLQQSGHIPRSLESGNLHETIGFTPNVDLDKHCGLTIEYGSLLAEIRSCAGYENFLRPKPFSSLLPSTDLGDGYIVFINVYQTRCDALILTPNGVITPVALPDLSLERANQLQLLWIEQLTSRTIRMRGAVESLSTDIATDSTCSAATAIRHSSRLSLDDSSSVHLLEHTWNWIVGPILEALGLTNSVPSGPLPHITWCPTGPLTRIPLHAAGVYNDPNGPRVFNYIVSSYTPSLSALLRSSRGIAEQCAAPSVLIVTQPATPGQRALPGTVDEHHRLERLLNEAKIDKEILNGEQATTTAIRAAIDQHPWVHLACHGSQRTGDATQSAFHLYDGPLSLSDLMQTAADSAELAFLSACQTATGDESNPEESVHLAAGMLAVGFKGVVATMWSIGDRDAPIVVEAYYKKLLELRRAGAVGKGQTGAAYALHEAVKVLRDVDEKNFLSWAPFVHFGA
ncbi:hypothetical protein PENSPDRAFT_314518 [Peniophora sp. CONT]|nr:hypothetical protein PENSPDRAFT_314518 [Peniophora sp. CONT]